MRRHSLGLVTLRIRLSWRFGIGRTSSGLFAPYSPPLSQIPGTAQTRMDRDCPLCPLRPLQKKQVAELCSMLSPPPIKVLPRIQLLAGEFSGDEFLDLKLRLGG